MKALISMLILITFAVFLGSCKDSGPVINSPVNQTDKMVFTITGSSDGMTTAPAGMTKPYRHYEGDGLSTPGGQSHMTMDYWAIPSSPTTGSPAYGNAVLTTESGDKIYGINVRGTYVINPVTLVVTCDVTFDLAGGTGAYDNIVGIVHGTAIINADRTTHIEWTGTYSHAKPFSGEFTGTNGTVQNFTCTTGYTPRRTDGEGTALHLGSCVSLNEHCINFTTGVLKNGAGSFTAKNGEKVNAIYDGFVVPIPGSNNVAAKMFCTINGGTGRFANATGFFLVMASMTPEGVVTASFDGVIDW